MSKSPVTCHVLDAALGRPAAGIRVELAINSESAGNHDPRILATGVTNDDGRCTTLLEPDTRLSSGVYKMTFYTGDYFGQVPHFYPKVEITFNLGADSHYHIPLLLSPYSYTTYRGS